MKKKKLIKTGSQHQMNSKNIYKNPNIYIHTWNSNMAATKIQINF